MSLARLTHTTTPFIGEHSKHCLTFLHYSVRDNIVTKRDGTEKSQKSALFHKGPIPTQVQMNGQYQ